MLTKEQYNTIQHKLWTLKTPEEFDAFRRDILEKIDRKDPYLRTLVNFYGDAKLLRGATR
jgi:hypothetical protein